MLKFGYANLRATDGELFAPTGAANSAASRWENHWRRLKCFAVRFLLLLIGLSMVSISQPAKPLSVSVRVDTSKVFSFSPVRLVIATGVKKLFPTVDLKEYCLVSVAELYRIDTVRTVTYPFENVADTTYRLSSHGTADSLSITIRPEQRHVVTIHSVYYDLKWKRIPNPPGFLPDVSWSQIK
jgi:hypothetical protein